MIALESLGRRRWPLLALFLMLLPACAAHRAPIATPEVAAPAPAPPPAASAPSVDPQPIYGRLDSARQDYEVGLELLAAGDELLGEEHLRSASNTLDAAAAECAATAGCDLRRFLDTLNGLLSRSSIALKRQAFRLDSIEESLAEADEAEREPGTEPVVTALPEIGRSISLLRGSDLREIISLNGPVRAALNDWLTWMRPMLLDSYEQYTFLRDRIAPVYEEAGLPEALLFAMLATESGGKVHATSRAGATGLLQFMPYTGRRYGLGVVDGFDQRLDPVAATRANVAYLNDQLKVLNDDLEKALAAYNGGENRMAGLHRRHAGAGFWDSNVYWALPRETREYVPRVLAAAWLFLNPERYNLDLGYRDGKKTSLALREAIAIDELSVCLGQDGSRNGWFRALRNLNPRHGPGDRIPAGTEIVVPQSVVKLYEERCLGGEVLARARELHGAAHPRQPEVTRYTVRRGDTLSSIAGRHSCVTLGELAALNSIRPPRYVIAVGQELKIPSCR